MWYIFPNKEHNVHAVFISIEHYKLLVTFDIKFSGRESVLVLERNIPCIIVIRFSNLFLMEFIFRCRTIIL